MHVPRLIVTVACIVACCAVLSCASQALAGDTDGNDAAKVIHIPKDLDEREMQDVRDQYEKSLWGDKIDPRANKIDSRANSISENQVCDFNDLNEGLVWSRVFAWMKAHKEELAFLPPKIAQEREEEVLIRESDIFFAKFRRGLEVLNRNRKTLVLMYAEDRSRDREALDRYTCSWLIDPTGIIAKASIVTPGHASFDIPMTDEEQKKRAPNAYLALDDDFLQGIWNGLMVRTRSALRGPEPRRAEGCDDTSFPEVALTNEQFEFESSALQRASEILMPPPIADMLLKEAVANGRLLIIPVNSGQKIPFPALSLGSDYLIDKYVTMIVPSANAIADVFDANRGSSALSSKVNAVLPGGHAIAPVTSNASAPPVIARSLIVGDPDLSGDKTTCWPKLTQARDEALFISTALSDAAPLIDKAATFDRVVNQLKLGQKTLKYIHFATHGVSDPINPADGSFLALSGRNLTGTDLRKLHLKFSSSPLVVMSACFSGLGKVFPNGVFGLTDFWLDSGASQVVVSLWSVSDIGTDKLMQKFIMELKEGGSSSNDKIGPSAENALAIAMRKLKVEEHDPAIWAAFTVIGRATE